MPRRAVVRKRFVGSGEEGVCVCVCVLMGGVLSRGRGKGL